MVLVQATAAIENELLLDQLILGLSFVGITSTILAWLSIAWGKTGWIEKIPEREANVFTSSNCLFLCQSFSKFFFPWTSTFTFVVDVVVTWLWGPLSLLVSFQEDWGSASWVSLPPFPTVSHSPFDFSVVFYTFVVINGEVSEEEEGMIFFPKQE